MTRQAIDLLKLNIGLENKINAAGDLIPIPEKESTIFIISHCTGGYITHFRHDVPVDIRDQIKALAPEIALDDHQQVQSILSQFTSCENVFSGKGYFFAQMPPSDQFPDVVYHEGCYVVKVDGDPVSWAWSQDYDDQAAELAVMTSAPFVRRGYARQVASAWAASVIQAGKVAFYSHKIDNFASEALARSLRVIYYATSTGYFVTSLP